MSELNPVDSAVLELLKQSRQAQEQETTDRAHAIHEASRLEDVAVTVGGLLLQECAALSAAFAGREKFYLDDANWLQKRRLRASGQFKLPFSMKINGAQTSPSRVQEYMMRRHNLNKSRRFSVGGLLPTDSELTDAGPIMQDWVVITQPFFVFTAVRTFNTERQELVSTTQVHKISTIGEEASVYEHDEAAPEEEYYFPLGLIAEANKKVRATVPRRIARKW